MEEQKVREIVEALHPLEIKVLEAFKTNPVWSHSALQEEAGIEPPQLGSALGWLQAKAIVKVEQERSIQYIGITDRGKQYALQGLPEVRVLKELKLGRKLMVQDLREQMGMEQLEVSTTIGNLKEHRVVRVGQGGALEWTQTELPEFVTSLQTLLGYLRDQPEPIECTSAWYRKEYEHLIHDILEKTWKTRGVIKIHERKAKQLALTKLGHDLVGQLTPEAMGSQEISQLLPAMLQDGSWRGKAFRKYNISLKPPRVLVGKKHPYREFLDLVKTKLNAMGFEEMRGPMVETEFWNMDALYMPQFHPARDIHDVYFVKEPQYARSLPEPYLSQVAQVHHSGWKTGSVGWRYSFDIHRAKRLVLRSQGTAVSARTLAGQSNSDGPKIPGKYFSVARCFRYDQVDATHACDFFQVEGIVLGEEINFRTLLGLLQLFALEVAKAREVKFLPAYFPFTEPSVELHVRHPKLGWMELGGAGLFRPEVTRPLGIEVPVIAWGLGLDRMAMVALEISDIRDLFSTDLDLIRTKRVKQ
ncbi:MAG: phenylalanine--tRNA ligase subunit alpha [Nitrospira sp.]|nr:phenylalanine--tRNA ligase subunit alpha [Nitrospira sp.]